MGGVPGVLLCLWCRGGCSASTVASALTFFPPDPPCYKVKKKEGSDELELVVEDFLEAGPTTGVEMAMIKTKGKSTIPLALHRGRVGTRYTLVYSHGNATDIGAMHERCSSIAQETGINVIVYDYTGYGVASGMPSERHTYHDIEAVYNWAKENFCGEDGGEGGSAGGGGGAVEMGGTNRPARKKHGIILYGQSVGSGPTCYLLAKRKPDIVGVILHSPIMSGMRVLTDSRVLSCLDIYPNLEYVSKAICPVIVMHGMQDEEVLWEHGKGIHDAVPTEFQRQPWWVSDRGHNDICKGRRHLREFFKRLKLFIESLEPDKSVNDNVFVSSGSEDDVKKVVYGGRNGKEGNVLESEAESGVILLNESMSSGSVTGDMDRAGKGKIGEGDQGAPLAQGGEMKSVGEELEKVTTVDSTSSGLDESGSSQVGESNCAVGVSNGTTVPAAVVS